MPNATTLAALTTVAVSQDFRAMDAHAKVCSCNASFCLILRQFRGRPDNEVAASRLAGSLNLIVVFVSVLEISATNFFVSSPFSAKNENIAVLYIYKLGLHDALLC